MKKWEKDGKKKAEICDNYCKIAKNVGKEEKNKYLCMRQRLERNWEKLRFLFLVGWRYNGIFFPSIGIFIDFELLHFLLNSILQPGPWKPMIK